MKAFKSFQFKVIILVLAFVLLSTTVSGFALNNENYSVAPEGLFINTEDNIIGKFYYDDFVVNVQKIVSAAGLGYCLDLDKDYPTGEKFKSDGPANGDINIILSNGYPNRSVEELGVNDEDEAYLATQVALWTLFEGYNVKKIDTGNAEVNADARNIYNNVINNKRYELENDTILYRTNDSNIQGIVIYVKQPIEIKPIPPTEVVPPVVVPPEEVIPPTSDEKPTVDNNNNTTDEGTAGVSDNIQNDAPLGK